MWRRACNYKSEFIHGNDGMFTFVYMTRVADIKISGELLFKSVKIMKDKERLSQSWRN